MKENCANPKEFLTINGLKRPLDSEKIHDLGLHKGKIYKKRIRYYQKGSFQKGTEKYNRFNGETVNKNWKDIYIFCKKIVLNQTPNKQFGLNFFSPEMERWRGEQEQEGQSHGPEGTRKRMGRRQKEW